MNAAITTTADTRTKHAKATAYACGFLALLIFIVNAWLVIEGIQSTEPASEARYAHIAQSVLLALIEFSLFAISGLFPEFKNSFRAIGILILTLEIGLMSISQISTGLTAGKVAARSDDVVAQLKSKVDISMAQVKVEQDTAKNLNGSKHGWRHEQAAQQSTLAGTHAKSATSDIEAFQKASTVGAAVSTPMVEIIGKNGLAALSIALAFGLSISGIALTHCMGSLIRRSSVMPVDLQILELLHRVHGAPVVPAPIPMTMQVQAAPASFKPAGTVTPKDATSGFSYTGKTMMAGAGALAAMAAPVAHSAPAVPATVSKPIHADVSKPIHLEHANEGGADASNAASVAPETIGAGVSKPIHEGVSKPIQQIVKKPRAKRATSAKLDTGVEGKAGARFKRIRDGVKAGKIRPSVRGIQAVEGGSQAVVADYLQQLETEGVIIKAGRGYVLANSKGGAA